MSTFSNSFFENFFIVSVHYGMNEDEESEHDRFRYNEEQGGMVLVCHSSCW